MAIPAARDPGPLVTLVRSLTVENVERITVRLPEDGGRVVNNRSMPLGNKTGMTQDERNKLGAWIAAQK